MKNNKDLYILQNSGFDIISFLTIILYISTTFGLFVNAPQYLNDLHFFVQIYVSLFLILRFNPFRKIVFNDLDRRIAFSAGVFLFATSAIDKYLHNYLINFKDYLASNL